MQAFPQSLAVKDEQVARLETRCSQLSRELSHVHSQVEQGNYRIEHFDAMIRLEECWLVTFVPPYFLEGEEGGVVRRVEW